MERLKIEINTKGRPGEPLLKIDGKDINCISWQLIPTKQHGGLREPDKMILEIMVQEIIFYDENGKAIEQ